MKKQGLLLLSLLMIYGMMALATDVTFRVNMSQQTIPPVGVHIAGNFQGWDPGATLMTDAGDNIYTFTQSFDAGSSLEYKYERKCLG